MLIRSLLALAVRLLALALLALSKLLSTLGRRLLTRTLSVLLVLVELIGLLTPSLLVRLILLRSLI